MAEPHVLGQRAVDGIPGREVPREPPMLPAKDSLQVAVPGLRAIREAEVRVREEAIRLDVGEPRRNKDAEGDSVLVPSSRKSDLRYNENAVTIARLQPGVWVVSPHLVELSIDDVHHQGLLDHRHPNVPGGMS